MSMYRQLWLAIIISTLLALTGSLLASLLSARSYLEQQLSMKNADNASALALSLSQQQPDAVMVELAVAALFDSGHYEYIRVRDPNGKVIIERIAVTGQLSAPGWFMRSLPITPAPGTAQISNGWTQFGSVELGSHSRFGYDSLWTSTKEMVVALALAGLIGGYLGSLTLSRLRRPLQSVIEQAEAITNRRFVSIPEPDVPELRQLAAAMNDTVFRLKAMFEEEAARLETVRREANCDPLTGLANRNFFMAQLRSSLEGEHSTGGTLLLIRVADLVGINKRLGREATDDLLRRVADVLTRYGSRTDSTPGPAAAENIAGRMNGADFALLLPGQRVGRHAVATLLETLTDAMEPFVDKGSSAFISMGTFKEGTGLGVLLAQVDAALIAAEAEGATAVREAVIETDNDVPKSNDQWTAIIRQALDRRWVRLVSFPVVDLQGRLIHDECPLRLMFDAQGEWMPAGRFLPVAERLGLSADLDLETLALGLADLERRPQLKGLAVNLSASSLARDSFAQAVEGLLTKHRKVASRLWVEVAETGALKHVDAFRNLCKTLARHQCRVGVEHFGRQFSQIGQLHDLGLSYIKVDASFIRGIEDTPGNQAFLKGVSAIAHAIGIMVIAEGVMNAAELSALGALGFDGATGPGIRSTDNGQL